MNRIESIRKDWKLIETLMEENRSILDIGCGSGILSIMLAQRTNASITAIDIEKGACQQTEINIQNCPFNNTFNVICQDIKTFGLDGQTSYDLIICNPPYYSNQDQRTNQEAYNLAKHADAGLDFESLSQSVGRILSRNGAFWFILPVYEAPKLIKQHEKNGLKLNYKLVIKHQNQSQNARWICQFRFIENKPKTEFLTVRNQDNSYTSLFQEKLKNYYIKF